MGHCYQLRVEDRVTIVQVGPPERTAIDDALVPLAAPKDDDYRVSPLEPVVVAMT